MEDNWNTLYKKNINKQFLHNVKELRDDLINKTQSGLKKNNRIYSSFIKAAILNEELEFSDFISYLMDLPDEGLIPYAKDPVKQNMGEKTTHEFMTKKLKPYSLNVDKLPDKGNGSIFLCENGNIVKGNKNKDKNYTYTKSLDFQITGTEYDIWVYDKHTKEAGGSQDNQKNDVHDYYLKFANNNNNDKAIFVALVNGKYYEKYIAQWCREFDNDNIIITNCDDLINNIKCLF